MTVKNGNANDKIKNLMKDFAAECAPFERDDELLQLSDGKTGAHYCECHIKGSKLISLGTPNVPLDPDEPDYRANREIVEDDLAFQRMKEDAKQKRSFSNIVVEWTKEHDADHPLKIIGGQHRFEAIKEALTQGVPEVGKGSKIGSS